MWSLPSRSLAVAFVAVAVLVTSSAVVSGRVTDARFDAAPQPPCLAADPPAPNTNLIQNGGFSDGTSCWLQFATPDMTHIVSQVTEGVFQYYRVPGVPGERPNQAVIFQPTVASVAAGTPMVATFDVANSSSVRKRVSVLVHEHDFSDLHVCTFWLAPNTPKQTYTMRTHTTTAWLYPTISFYAASGGSDGGYYEIDDVTLMYDPAEAADRTLCGDPNAPVAPGGPAGPDLIVNGDFSAGLSSWAVMHGNVYQLAGGVVEFIWASLLPENAAVGFQPPPAPVVLQRTGMPMIDGQILTANVEVGNSSIMRKRVSVLIHQWDFADLAVCTFWLEPNTPLQTYTMRSAATIGWGDATLSVYAATWGPDPWIQVDNASLRRTPGNPTVGTECFEPSTPPDSSLRRGVQDARQRLR
jgi:hypothetical protein